MPSLGRAQHQCHREMASHQTLHFSQVQSCSAGAALILTCLRTSSLLRRPHILESSVIDDLAAEFFGLAGALAGNHALRVTLLLPGGPHSTIWTACQGRRGPHAANTRMPQIIWLNLTLQMTERGQRIVTAFSAPLHIHFRPLKTMPPLLLR